MPIDDDQKPSLDDALKHYGVKGMKWDPGRARIIRPMIPSAPQSRGSWSAQHQKVGAAVVKSLMNSHHAKVVVSNDKNLVWPGAKGFQKPQLPRIIRKPPGNARMA